jgi:Family of unknown function (DUF5989)
MEIVAELLTFMLRRKKFWLWPVMLFLVVMGTLLMLSHGSVIAPFIYTIF